MSDQRELAETIALRALAWLAANDELLPGFLAASGASLEEMRARAGDAGFLASVLDYLLTEDALVIGFCDSAGLDYSTPMRMRQVLPGGQVHHWT